MGWNLVQANISYKSGKFPALAFADDSIEVGVRSFNWRDK